MRKQKKSPTEKNSCIAGKIRLYINARLSQISTVLAPLLFAVSEHCKCEFDVLEVKGSTNEVSIYFYRHITDRIRSAKHDSCIAAGFWKWTEVISAREKSENEALI